MKGQFFAVFITIILIYGCISRPEVNISNDAGVDLEPVHRDLQEIQKTGVLKVMINYGNTSYFLYRGKPMGFEYELLNRLAKELNLELDLIIINNKDSIFYDLNTGKADLIAFGLTVTAERKQHVNFTDYLYVTSQVLVQKKPDNWELGTDIDLQKHLVHDAIGLIGETVSVRQNTAYYKRLYNLTSELGDTIYIDTLPGDLSTEEIIKKVAEGEIKYTVSDKNLAQVAAANNPDLDIRVPISFSQRIAWAVRKNSPQLLDAVNQWLAKEKKEDDYYVIYNRYFKNKRSYTRRRQSGYNSLNGNNISEYDALIKKYAGIYNWDWRFIAAVIYQESRFDPEAESWAGALGLMQVMPLKTKEMELIELSDPEQNIKFGTFYLKQLYEQFNQIEDSVERIKFTLASYNCGYSHVMDAIYMAKQENLDPHVWTDNVELAISDLNNPMNYNLPGIKYGYVRGIETVAYVDDILTRYKQYENFIKE